MMGSMAETPGTYMENQYVHFHTASKVESCDQNMVRHHDQMSHSFFNPSLVFDTMSIGRNTLTLSV